MQEGRVGRGSKEEDESVIRGLKQNVHDEVVVKSTT